MTEEQQLQQQQPAGPAPGSAPQEPPASAWGAPPPPRPPDRPRWTVRRTVVAVAVAVGIAAAGGVAIYAASGSTDRQGDPPGGARMVMGGPMFDTAHGEFQNGEVTSLDDDELTVRSDDGYEGTYKIGDGVVLDGIEEGDTVMVVATVSGDTTTATSVIEPGQDQLGRRGGPGGPGGSNSN